MCQCYQIGGPFIAEDPECPAHGVGGFAERVETLEERVVLLERALRELVDQAEAMKDLDYDFNEGLEDDLSQANSLLVTKGV